MKRALCLLSIGMVASRPNVLVTSPKTGVKNTEDVLNLVQKKLEESGATVLAKIGDQTEFMRVEAERYAAIVKFALPVSALVCIPVKGTLLATDEGTEWRTPYDNCTLIMPSMGQLRPGVTVVRLATTS